MSIYNLNILYLPSTFITQNQLILHTHLHLDEKIIRFFSGWSHVHRIHVWHIYLHVVGCFYGTPLKINMEPTNHPFR